MRVHPIVIAIFCVGIAINSLGRLILTPLHYPLGLPLTTIGYIIWALTYLYITICSIIAGRFNIRTAFWLVFTALAPVQYMAAHSGKTTLNHITATILISQMVIASIVETVLFVRRRQP